MITCVYCGVPYNSVEEYEKHMDFDCSQKMINEQVEIIGTQIIRNGKSEFKILSIKPTIADEFLQRKPTDEDLTEP